MYESMCGMIAFRAIISGANPIPQVRSAWRIAAAGPRRTWTFATPRAGTFARAGK